MYVAMHFELHADGRRCTIRLSDTIALDDLLAGIRAQVDADAWTRETLIDTTAATGILTDYPDARRVLGFIKAITSQLPPRGPVVILVGNHDAIYGMARMYQTMSSEQDLRVTIVRQAVEVGDAFAQMV